MTEMAFLMGLLVAISWGISDYLAGKTSRLVGVNRTAIFTQSVGFIFVSMFILMTPAIRIYTAEVGLSGWGYGATSVLLNLAGALGLLKAFSLGRVALIAPLVTGYAAITTTLDFFTGTPLAGLQLVGIIFCLIGAPLAAAKAGSDNSYHASGVLYALASSVCFGVGFWIQGKFAVPELGAALSLWLFFAIGVPVLLLIMTVKRENILPPRAALPILSCRSFCTLIGYGGFAIGVSYGSVAVVTVLSTFAAAVAAVLGLTFGKERLNSIQWIGLISIILGVVLLRIP
ncbi:EamA family transporter [Brucella pituitosa]|uniref:EamA family transporter n=1 Tax=Brucella pituitosa TaxID=571256 RepID=UPI003F4AD3A3